MKTINTFAEITELSEQGNLYVRWSRGPEADKAQGRSRDYTSGNWHSGLSCQRISPDNSRNLTAMMLVEYQFLRRKDADIYGWIFFAIENGRDSDNAPTVDANSIVPVARLSDDLIATLSAYNEAYWAHNNMPKAAIREMGGQVAWLNATPRLADYVNTERV